jgi:hypothetical protein
VTVRGDHRRLRSRVPRQTGPPIVALVLHRTLDVDCWIGVARTGDQRVLRLAGRLSAAQVPELLRACAEDGPLTLDLTDMVSADATGIDALQRIRARGATLTGTAGYIQLKLDTAGDSRDRPQKPGGRG